MDDQNLTIVRNTCIVFMDCRHGFIMRFRVYLHNVLLHFDKACGDNDQCVM
jgi:hypothetical protein